MILTAWGSKPGTSVIDNMPLWVKFSNLPDCYWTEEGLSRIASVIGEPLGADEPTSRLDIMPFAKLQVKYKLGDPMPNEISVTVIDPSTEQRSLAKVQVSYPIRPLSCSGCHSLGHSIAACPSITRVWQKKETKVDDANVKRDGHDLLGDTDKAQMTSQAAGSSSVQEHDASKEDNWTEIKRKSQPVSSDIDCSPSPPANFRNLKKVDEIDVKKGFLQNKIFEQSSKKPSKSQRKKLKASQGTGSPSQS